MRRKQFIDKLNKISELNNQLNCMYEVPMFCCKQYKINSRANRNNIKKRTEGSQNNIVSQPRVVTSWKEQSRPCSAVSSNSKIAQQRCKNFKNMSSNIVQNDFQSTRNDSLVIEKINKAVVIKTELSETERDQLFQFKDKRLVREIPIKRRNLLNSSMSSTFGGNQKIQKKLSITEASNPTQNPTSGRILCISGMLSKGRIQKSSSIKQYHSHKVYQAKEGSPNIDRQMKLAMRKQINNNYRKPFNPPPKITAKSYIVYQTKSAIHQSSIVTSFNAKSSQEVASLTKIMTCIVVLELCQQMCVDIYCEEVLIGKMESSIGGTTAHLQKGQIYTIEQLLHGLMLPSGNDASLALAVWAGKKLLKKDQQNGVNVKEISKKDMSPGKQSTTTDSGSSSVLTKQECYARFITQMNVKAKQLKMLKTNYANSHGLVNFNNKSSAYDIAILSEYALKNETFRKIVSTRSYEGLIRVNLDQIRSTKDISSDQQNQYQEDRPKKKIIRSRFQSKKGQSQKKVPIFWQNTQKLLKNKEYIGIKTGYTIAAGPCLASCVSTQGRQFIIVVLSCCRMSMRFRETQVLRKWLYKHEGIKKSKKGNSKYDDEQEQEEYMNQGTLEPDEVVPDTED